MVVSMVLPSTKSDGPSLGTRRGCHQSNLVPRRSLEVLQDRARVVNDGSVEALGVGGLEVQLEVQCMVGGVFRMFL